MKELEVVQFPEPNKPEQVALNGIKVYRTEYDTIYLIDEKAKRAYSFHSNAEIDYIKRIVKMIKAPAMHESASQLIYQIFINDITGANRLFPTWAR